MGDELSVLLTNSLDETVDTLTIRNNLTLSPGAKIVGNLVTEGIGTGASNGIVFKFSENSEKIIENLKEPFNASFVSSDLQNIEDVNSEYSNLGTVGISTLGIIAPFTDFATNHAEIGDGPFPPSTEDGSLYAENVNIQSSLNSKNSSIETANLNNLTVTGTINIPPVGFAFPGAITIWGSLDPIPDGWVLCDGNNGTPNLVGFFPRGTTSSVDLGTTGGSSTITLIEDNLPPHSHGATTNAAGTHQHDLTLSYDSLLGVGVVPSYYNPVLQAGFVNYNADPAGDHFHNYTVDATGDGDPANLQPPTIFLKYIMKI